MNLGVTGVVLAGGQSRRMGRNKAFLPWGEATLLEHVLRTLRPLMDELLVVVNDAGPFQGLRARVVEDLVPGAHALGGLYTGLRAASHPLCFVCGCDTPFLNPAVIRFLLRQADGYEAVIPKTSDGLQPLHAVYRASIATSLEEPLHLQRWELSKWAERLHARLIEPAMLEQIDPLGLSWCNLNAPADYARAARRFRGH